MPKLTTKRLPGAKQDELEAVLPFRPVFCLAMDENGNVVEYILPSVGEPEVEEGERDDVDEVTVIMSGADVEVSAQDLTGDSTALFSAGLQSSAIGRCLGDFCSPPHGVKNYNIGIGISPLLVVDAGLSAPTRHAPD